MSLGRKPKRGAKYMKDEIPNHYKCRCGATNCKLWRKKQFPIQLFCAKCACADQELPEIKKIDDWGRSLDKDGNFRDVIGDYEPACASGTNRDKYWQLNPDVTLIDAKEAYSWWCNLPSLPQI